MVMRGGIWLADVLDRPEAPRDSRFVAVRFATPGFFQALGIPLLRGRDVAASDGPEGPQVAVVSASFAERLWPGLDPLGRRLRVMEGERAVVGVVGDVHVRGLERRSEPQVYLPYRQQPDASFTYYAPKDLAVRTTGDPVALAEALRAIVRRADPEQTISDLRPLAEIVDGETAPRRAQLVVLAAFAAIAVLLASIGIHGLLSFAVSSRAREIGVRMALGAERGDIVRRVVGEGALLAAAGVLGGVLLASVGARLLESVLFGVRPDDPLTFGAAALIGLGMAAAGALLPALRAVRVDPARVMRAE
jgi:predicted permease